MTDYVDDVKKYTSNVNEAVVDGIVKHLGIALQNKDSSLVACSDQTERDRIRNGFMRKKLGSEDTNEALDAAILSICETMKATNQKSRVTFYYLLAEKFGKLGIFA